MSDTLTFTIDNTASISAATGLAFLDTLPVDLVVSAVPAVVSTVRPSDDALRKAGYAIQSLSAALDTAPDGTQSYREWSRRRAASALGADISEAMAALDGRSEAWS